MPSYTFDASYLTQRIKALNIAQQMYGSMNNNKNPISPQTGYNSNNTVNNYIFGSQTTYNRSLEGKTLIQLGGIANYVTPPIETGGGGGGATVPGAPTINSVTPGNTTATVNFTAGSTGGSIITDYKYSINGSTYVSAGTIASPFTITGLTNGQTYPITIKAVNAIGDSIASNSVNVTPVAPSANITGTASWATSIISGAIPNSFNIYNKTATDSAGNIYIIGRYTSDTLVTIGTVTLPLTYVTFPPASNGFLIKYNSSGVTQWAINLPSSSGAVIQSIAIDSGDNIYLACNYFSITNITIQNATDTGQTPSLIQLPSSDKSAIIKYISAGIAVWATSFFTDTNTFAPNSIAVDSTNSVYLAGYYNSSTDVTLNIATTSSSAPTPTSKTLASSSGNQYGYLLKYDTNGNPLWSIYVQGYTTSTQVKSISIDSDNNICMIGELNNNNLVTLTQASGDTQAPSSYTLPAIEYKYVFLAKYTSNGAPLWSTYLYRNDSIGQPLYRGNNIVVDSDKNIYIVGDYNNGSNSINITLQNASGTGQIGSTYTLQGTITQTAYLIKYDSTGQVVWSTYFKATLNTGGVALSVDSTNNVYMSGYYQTSSVTSTYDANSTGQSTSSYTLPATNTFGPTNTFMFLIKYNSSGATQWATYVGNYDTISPTAIPIIIQSSNLYIAGRYMTTDPNIIQVQNASGTGQTPATGIILPNTNSKNSVYLIKYN